MIKKSFVVFSGAVIFSLLFSFVVLAEDPPLPQAGMTPDSPLYFLKSWKERIQTFVTLGAENKAKQFLHLADVRLAEYQKMIEKGKTEIAEKTLEKYQDQLNRALTKVQEVKDKGKDVQDITEKLEQKTTKHLEVLQQNLQKVPEQAKKGIQKTMEASRNAYQKASGKLVITGTFSPKGVECRGFEGDDGVFYTLVSEDPASPKLMPSIDSSFRDGDRATIKGRLLKVSYCMQGNPVLVEKITPINQSETAKGITVLSPNGGEKWVMGSTYNITWKSSGLDMTKGVGIILYDTSIPTASLSKAWQVENIPNTGTYSFVVPNVPASNKYQIYISTPEAYDQSDNYFSIVSSDETADWKTYRNEKYGFELKYPASFEIYQEKEQTVLDILEMHIYWHEKLNSQNGFGIIINPAVFGAFETMESYKPPEKINIGGITSEIISAKEEYNGVTRIGLIAQLKHNKNLFVISAGGDTGVEEIFKNILFTFKFIK